MHILVPHTTAEAQWTKARISPSSHGDLRHEIRKARPITLLSFVLVNEAIFPSVLRTEYELIVIVTEASETSKTVQSDTGDKKFKKFRRVSFVQTRVRKRHLVLPAAVCS
jgi:hypothetical protein